MEPATNHPDACDTLRAELDGATASAALAAHARSCTACAAWLRAQARLWQALGSVPAPPVAAFDPAFREAVVQRARRASPRTAARGLGLLALLAVLAGVGWWALGFADPTRRASDSPAQIAPEAPPAPGTIVEPEPGPADLVASPWDDPRLATLAAGISAEDRRLIEMLHAASDLDLLAEVDLEYLDAEPADDFALALAVELDGSLEGY